MDSARLTWHQVLAGSSPPDLRGHDFVSHVATCRACLLALSDERAQALALRMAASREGYMAGQRDEYAEREADWASAAQAAARAGPSFAELDRLRYPPSGRAGWLDRRDREQTPEEHQ